MFDVEYYRGPEGQEPVYNWINSLDNRASATIMAKIDALKREGLKLLQTKMMKRIVG